MAGGKKKLMPKVKSFSDLKERAKVDERYQKLCIAALRNLGAEGLAESHTHFKEEWEKSYYGLHDYWGVLVGEYGMSEDKAERDVLAEINFVRGCVE